MVLPRELLKAGAGCGVRGAVIAGALASFLAAWQIPRGASAFEGARAQLLFRLTAAEGRSFSQPSDLAVFEGEVIVLDGMNNRLCRFDLRGRALGCVAGTRESPLRGAMGMAVDRRGTVYVTDGYRGKVLKLPKGKGPEQFITIARDQEQLPADPTGIVFFGERFYVADNDNHVIRVFNENGEPEGSWGGQGEAPGRFSYPFRLATDRRGRIAVTDVLNSRIQFFTPRGEYLASLGTHGVVSGTLYRPGGMDIDDGGNVIVADNYFGTVQAFSPSGEFLDVFRNESGSVLQLEDPVAVKVDKERFYAVEMAAGRISVFRLGAGP